MISGQISGTIDPRFAKLRQAFQENFDSGLEIGASVAVTLDGEPVAHLWGGMADPTNAKAWQEDTLVNVWSVTKAVVAVAAAIAVERGQLAYDTPMAHYWPEFAAGGKEAITLDLVMSHRAGLNGLSVPLGYEGLIAWNPYVDALAAMEPLWEPGSVCVYHALTYGHLVGETLARATGTPIGAFIASEISAPLGLSFFVGLPESQDHRVALMIAGNGARDWVNDMVAGPYPHSCANPTPDPLDPNKRAFRAASVPGGNGQSDALSLARLMGGLASGNSPILSPQGLKAATAIRFDGMDSGFNSPSRYGAGFNMGSETYGKGASRDSFGHTGWGGSFTFGDPASRVGFAYVTNHILGFETEDPRRVRLTNALWDCV